MLLDNACLNTMIAAFNHFPPLQTLLDTAKQYGLIAICLPNKTIPALSLSENATQAEKTLRHRLQNAFGCLQFAGANVLRDILPDTELWLMPPEAAHRLHEYFPQAPIWQTTALPQTEAVAQKPWFIPPCRPKPQRAAIIGAGIAGAATARALAERGVQVCVLESARPAEAASGNRQGLLYTRISPHDTEQTELLLCGYGHTRRLLERLLPKQTSWGGAGVLHLNHEPAEQQRNTLLSRQTHHNHLYHSVSAAEASAAAGIDLNEEGLFWPQGVWLHPPALVAALFKHPNITLHNFSPLQTAQHTGSHWQLTTPNDIIEADCIIYCTGADSAALPPLNILPFRLVRGQTSLAPATSLSENLRIALSGDSYLAPAWQGIHCYGATFIQHDSASDWRETEEQANRQALGRLHPELARSLLSDRHNLRGHAALRCDTSDHLPVVGALGDAAAMQPLYARLALDRKYPLTAACPYLPGVYINTAHGSRGLSSAPICADSLAAEILGLPNPLSRRIRQALHPNRFIIRAIARGTLYSTPTKTESP